MIIYSNLIKLFKHCGNYILFKLIMNIHEYSEYLDYFFDTLSNIHPIPRCNLEQYILYYQVDS